MSLVMPTFSLETEVQFLKNVGPKLAASLQKAGLHTVGQVLNYWPRRYEDRRNLPPIAKARPGEFATVRGRLVSLDTRPTRTGKVILKAVIRDQSGFIGLTWFNQPWIARQLEGYKGELLAYGMVKDSGQGVEMSSPEWERIEADDESTDFARIVPVYPLVDGLAQKTVRKAVESAITYFLDAIEDPLTPEIKRDHRLKDLTWSVRQMHYPEGEPNRLEARKRLVFDEFFYLQLALALRREETQQEAGIAFPIAQLKAGTDLLRPEEKKERLSHNSSVLELRPASETLFAKESTRTPLWDQVRQMFAFELTGAQQRVIEEIWSDMARPFPMNRLIQGDVGSGKTAVAACAILAAVRSGYQAAMMVPTEILAEQHGKNLRRILEPLGVEVELLIGKLTATQKRKVNDRVATGLANVLIGTHAVIQENVKFLNLGLVIVDEQHRFGVLQRKALRDKGLGNPDVLVMTATPIPRTLTMTLYGDLDVSVIDELPPGRKPIKTHWKTLHDRASVYAGIQKLVKEGRQAYFVCPLVSETEKLNAQAAEDLHLRLANEVFPELRVGLLHGQMKSKDKEEVMEQFRAHQLDILVSTTVIEVGVDVPNASVMVIEDANRFGLSQLHQLRGRVGRGEYQSFCLLIAEAKTDVAQARMEVMVSTNDGFQIAEEDLKLRGPGEIAGTMQSGNRDFELADLVQDSRMLEVARQAAMKMVEFDPKLGRPEHQLIKQKLKVRRAALAVIAIS